MAVVRCDHAEPGRKMRFAGAGRSEQHNVAGFGEECSRRQRGDLLPCSGLMIPVEVVEGFVFGNPAQRIRCAAPDALCAETSRSSTAAR